MAFDISLRNPGSVFNISLSDGVVPQTASITESASASESQSAEHIRAAAITEAATAGDSHNGLRTTDSAQTETGTAGDSSSAANAQNVSQTESATASDSQNCSAIYNVQIIEAAVATDIVVVFLLMFVLKYWNGVSHERGALKCYVKKRGGWITPKLKCYSDGEWKDVDSSG